MPSSKSISTHVETMDEYVYFSTSKSVKTYPMRPLLLLTFFATTISCTKPNDVEWIKENAHPITTLYYDSTTFEDLEPLGKLVGDANVVILGEAEHGDGSTFYLKSRIVKYLNSEKGFHVLAFESPFYNIHMAQQTGDFQNVIEPIYDMWRYSEACRELFKHAEHSSINWLRIEGIDSRHSGDTTPVKHIDALIQKYDIQIPEADRFFFNRTLTDALKFEYTHNIDTPSQERLLNLLVRYREELSKTDVDKFWIQELENLEAYCKHSWYCVVDEVAEYYNNSHRDKQMADNALWLLRERWKGEKIIIWAANMHTVKNYSTIDNSIYSKEEIAARGAEHSMGEYLAAEYDSLRSIITIAYGGKGADGDFKEYPMDTVHRHSVEAMFHNAGFKYGFLDVMNNDDEWLNNKRILNSGFYGKAASVNLRETCDGIFFIDEMQPNKRVK
jgi:erythromycin esterase